MHQDVYLRLRIRPVPHWGSLQYYSTIYPDGFGEEEKIGKEKA